MFAENALKVLVITPLTDAVQVNIKRVFWIGLSDCSEGRLAQMTKLTDAEWRMENIKGNWEYGRCIRPEDVEWVIEKTERLQKERDELRKENERLEQFEKSLWEISDTLEGENVTPLVERLAYVLSHSGIYNKDSDSE
jgi:hypothetical protein